MKHMQLDFNDYTILQGAVGLNSRSEADISDFQIFNAPMSTVLNLNNAYHFYDNGIKLVFPRNIKLEPNTIDFVSVGLEEFKTLLDGEKDLNYCKILIDIANGNLPSLHEMIKSAKTKWPNIVIMAGNIGSLHAFKEIVKTYVDYVRLNIGSGSACLTAVHTAVTQGNATLIKSCKEWKDYMDLDVKLIVDGGIKNYRDAIMAFAMGADVVMIGGLFNKCIEACGDKYIYSGYYYDKFEDYKTKWEQHKLEYHTDSQYSSALEEAFKQGILYHKYIGMSTKTIQKEWGRHKLKSSEGIEKFNKVEYTLSGWMENFKDYLRSAMAYTGAKNLQEFHECDVEQISPAAFNRFAK